VFWTDWLYDDHGAIGLPWEWPGTLFSPPRGTYTYPDGPAAGNGADIFRASIGLTDTGSWWRVDWNTLIDRTVPIALFTIGAVQNVKPVLIKTARVLKFGPIDLVTKVLFPAALPEIFTGLRIGFALTLIGTLLGEMFASQRGLGYMLMNAIGPHNVDIIMAVTFLLTTFAAVVSSILLAVDRRLHRRG